MIWAIPIYMAILSRACGGWLRIPGENFLYALPYAVVIWPIAGPYWAALGLIGAGIGKGQANREYMDLGTWTGPERKPHRYSVLFRWLRLPPYWHDFLGLALVGLAPALVPAILAGIFISPLAGLILAAGGMCKAPAYAIGHWLPSGKTETGETLTGLFAGMSIVAVITL